MNWLHFSLLTIALYSIHDITLKHLAGTVNSTLASAVINGSAAIVLVAYLLLPSGTGKTRFESPAFSANTFFLLLAGVSLGFATITFMNAFERDGKLSIAVPVVYAGVIVLCMLVGLVFFHEALDWRQWVGALLAVGGIYLMSATK